MKISSALAMAAAFALAVSAQEPARKEKPVTAHAKGTFDVKLQPVSEKDAVPARMTSDKQFHGDLEGTSKGEMLSAGTPDGSGVYVAIERFTGTLKGRSGTFVLHHTGIMTRGVPQLTIAVAPDSGTGQLAGITGHMSIQIVEKKHHYGFEYTLPENH